MVLQGLRRRITPILVTTIPQVLRIRLGTGTLLKLLKLRLRLRHKLRHKLRRKLRLKLKLNLNLKDCSGSDRIQALLEDLLTLSTIL